MRRGVSSRQKLFPFMVIGKKLASCRASCGARRGPPAFCAPMCRKNMVAPVRVFCTTLSSRRSLAAPARRVRALPCIPTWSRVTYSVSARTSKKASGFPAWLAVKLWAHWGSPSRAVAATLKPCARARSAMAMITSSMARKLTFQTASCATSSCLPAKPIPQRAPKVSA